MSPANGVLAIARTPLQLGRTRGVADGARATADIPHAKHTGASGSSSLAPGFGRQQDQLGEHDLLGLLAQRVQPGDPGPLVFAGRVVALGAHLRPQAGDLAGRLLAQAAEGGRGVAYRLVAGARAP